MGLDMYLYKKHYVKNWEHMESHELHEITIKKGDIMRKDIKPERICYITEEVVYWRKANAIHNWFVENVQDGEDNCQEYYVSKEQLSELLKEVKNAIKNKDSNKLPTKSGFFFGSTEYNDWYWQDLEYTEKTLTELLKEDDNDRYGASFAYSSSW